MLWERLSEPWRVCVEEAWTAYQHGSLPIGAAITDGRGVILSRGRNRIHELEDAGRLLSGHRLAHAEMNALVALEWRHIAPADCALYTTTEPCPLCVGAMRMTRIPEVHFASRDGAAGSADLFTANDFMRRGDVRVHGPFSVTLEALLVSMLIEFALHHNDENAPGWIARVAQTVPVALELGHSLARSGDLRAWAASHRPVGEVVDDLATRVRA